MWSFLFSLLKTLFQLAVVGAICFYGWQRYTDHQAQAAADADVPDLGPVPAASKVSALGRLEPFKGVRRIHGPSAPGQTVVADLLVEEGDQVSVGDVIATIDTEHVLIALVEQSEAELAHARLELERMEELVASQLSSQANADLLELRVAVAEADLKKARTDLDRARVRAPFGGTVLAVHARAGEVIGSAGIIELADVGRMYAVAEVYETDAARLRIGQRAEVRSPALEHALTGAVEFIHLKVDKQDVTGTDPASRQDARVIEVEIRLDDSTMARGYTNLQVEVVIDA